MAAATFVTSCAKGYEWHLHVQTSFAKPPNSPKIIIVYKFILLSSEFCPSLTGFAVCAGEECRDTEFAGSVDDAVTTSE